MICKVFERRSEKDLVKLAGHFSQEVGTCFLFSQGGYDTCQKSFLWLFPYSAFSIGHHEYLLSIDFEEKISSDRPWEILQKKITDNYWVGFFSYELGAYSDIQIPRKKSLLPFAYFQRCLCIIEYDHQSHIMKMHIDDLAKPRKNEQREIINRLSDLSEFLSSISQFSSPAAKVKEQTKKEQKASYLSKIDRAKEYILSGDVYQVNLSHEILLKGSWSYFSVFKHLCENNPSPFSAYFHFDKYAIVSTSPERLLRKKGRELETRPIKGTCPTGKTKEERHLWKKRLLGSVKERAELAMITDLSRNDVGKSSVVGSIKAYPFYLQEYEKVMHMYSIIRSNVLKEVENIELLRKIFPGGSITGCPKIRAQEIIYELEQRPRNIYTGSIGYFSPQKDFDFNICIRTLLFYEDFVSIQLGGAIVADSDPEKEYLETLLKGESLFQALNLSDEYCIFK